MLLKNIRDPLKQVQLNLTKPKPGLFYAVRQAQVNIKF